VRSKQTIIEDIIHANPGIGHAALREKTGFANGTIQYHVKQSNTVQTKRRALVPREHCQQCRFQATCTNVCKLKLLRDKTKQSIRKQRRQGRSYKEIADDLDLHPSTVSYHVARLRDQDLL
jgi:radical SAM protein with 4Fe4S-binding SPASM domain